MSSEAVATSQLAVGWYLQAACRLLREQFGPVTMEDAPLVAWDDRVVCRVTLPDGRRAIVKIDRLVLRHSREVLGLTAAHSCGVPVPRILWSRAGRPCLLVLLEIPARSSLKENRIPMNWRLAGESARKLHDAAIPPQMSMFEGGSGDWLAHLLDRAEYECYAAERLSLLSSRQAQYALEALIQRFSAIRTIKPVLLHGDLQARHVLIHAERAWLIDFGDAGWGDPAWDLTVLFHWNPERLADILEGYKPDPGLRAHLEQLSPAYSLLRHLRVARWYHENSFDALRSRDAAQRALEQLGRPLLAH